MEAALSSPVTRHNYQHSGIYPKNEMNMIGQMLSAVSAENGVRAVVDPLGIKVFGPQDDQSIFHFETFYLGVNSVGVRAGRYNRYSVEGQRTILVGVFPGWKDGAASIANDVSGDVDDYREITGISTVSTDHYIIGTLNDATGPIDDSLFPDAFDLSAVTSYPTADTTRLIVVIARVHTDSSGEIDDIEQYWNGGDIDAFFRILDQRSLGLVPNNDSLLQGRDEIIGWQEAVNNLWDNTDIVTTTDPFIVQDATDKGLHYILILEALIGIGDWTGVDFTGADWTGHMTDVAHDHGLLIGLDDDDHDGPDFPYMIIGLTTDKAGSYTRNTKGTDDNYLGRTLWVQTAVNTDIVNTEGGVASIGVSAHTLALDWTVTGTTDATNKDTGTLVLPAGGLGVELAGWFGGALNSDTGFVLPAAAVLNQWTNTAAKISPAGDVEISPDGAGFDIDLMSRNLDIALTGDLLMDGVTGKTIADVSNIFAKGIFTNEAGWGVVAIRTQLSTGGPPVNLQTIGRVL